MATVSIYNIQGAGHKSPLNGQSVTTTGIVTAIDSNGFYLQDLTGDGNNATSDAIFISSPLTFTVAVGDSLELTGTVSEFFPGGEESGNLSTTQISSENITVISSGNPLPVATIIGSGGRIPPNKNIDDDAFVNFDPETDGIDFFESLEGMLVTAKNAVAVAPINQFGEIFTVVDNGENATGLSQRGTLNISPDDFNPERVQVNANFDIFPELDIPDVNVGAKLGDVTGVVGYSFGNFEINPTQQFTVTPSTIQAETTSLENGAKKLTVASYNVLNLDPNDDDDDTDVADGRFSAIASQIVLNLKNPDVIGLQEIQDNDGTDFSAVAANETLRLLVDEIAANGGATYSFIDNTFIGDDTNGGEFNGNIRTAFLYNPNRVSFVDGSLSAITDANAQKTDLSNPFFDSRLPLAAKFTFNGEEVTVVNNHFSSKSGSAPILGVEQPFEQRQEDSTVNGGLKERQAQAQAVKGYVDGILAADDNANVVVLGDLNEFEFVSPVKTLAGSLTNLTETVSEDERYSSIFEGNSQSLDHILVSDNLKDDAEFDIVHVNSEFADTPQRASDRDPILASLTVLTKLENQIATQEVNGTTIESIDLSDFTGQVTVDFTISREADFNNEVYFYAVDDITGIVNGLAPDADGYLQAALSQDNLVSPAFSTSDDNEESGTVKFDAGSIIVPVIIADGTLAQALSGEAEVYFPYLGANTDNGNFDHIKLLDENTFAFEDLANGGDRDFNDIQIQFDNFRA